MGLDQQPQTWRNFALLPSNLKRSEAAENLSSCKLGWSVKIALHSSYAELLRQSRDQRLPGSAAWRATHESTKRFMFMEPKETLKCCVGCVEVEMERLLSLKVSWQANVSLRE